MGTYFFNIIIQARIHLHLVSQFHENPTPGAVCFQGGNIDYLCYYNSHVRHLLH